MRIKNYLRDLEKNKLLKLDVQVIFLSVLNDEILLKLNSKATYINKLDVLVQAFFLLRNLKKTCIAYALEVFFRFLRRKKSTLKCLIYYCILPKAGWQRTTQICKGLFAKALILFYRFFFVLLIFPITIFAQQKNDIINVKWVEAKEHLDSNRLEALLVSIEEMEGQIVDRQSSAYGKIAYLKGEYWYAKKEWDKALNSLDLAINLLKNDTAEHLILAESYLVGGYCFYDLEEFDKTFQYYQNTLEIKLGIYGRNHLKVSNVYFNLGYILQEKRNLIESDKYFLEGLSILQTLYTEENEHFADFYEELGFNQKEKGDYNEAIKYLDKARVIKTEKYGTDHEETAFSYHYLGLLFKKLERYKKSIDYYNKALQITESLSNRDVFSEAMLNLDIGKCHLYRKEYKKAYTYFEKAISIDKSNKYLAPEIHRLKGEVESKKGNLDGAWLHFQKSKKGFQKNGKNQLAFLAGTYKTIVQHLISTNNYQEALLYLNKALELGEIIFEDYPNEFFDLYRYKGICYLNLGVFKKAIFYFSKANEINGGNIVLKDANLMQLKNRISLNLEYVNLYIHQIEPTNELSLLLKTDTLLSKSINLVNYTIRTYQERSTKENFIEKFYEIFRKAVTIKYQLYEKTGKEEYLFEAFLFSEKSKNLILLEALKNVNAFELSGIPTPILDKGNELKTNITYLENRRFEEKLHRVENEEVIDQLNYDLFDLKQNYEKLLKQIAKDYPKYYELKFEATSISVKEIQQSFLTKDQSFLEYFITDSIVYVFLIKKDFYKVYPLPKSKGFDQKINLFRKSIYSYRPSSLSNTTVNNDTLIAVSIDLGFELYNELIAPFQDELTKKITVIADGSLGYLPFDALIKYLPKDKDQFRNHHYFMKDHLMSYAYSINWLNGLLDKPKTEFEQDFIGIAPIFEGTSNSDNIDDFRGGLGFLKHNRAEVIKIQNDIGGQIIINKEATLKNFLKHIRNGRILHLATHGKSNDVQGEYSFLAFAESNDTASSQFLYVKDLFNLKIPAELVVLSACETGLGEIKRGEGIVGIGKGFSYAGVKSLVSTLWRVSDNSTANFMPIFYKNLKKGMPKDEALWSAKKKIIKENRNAGHPFFWSGYVAYGDMQPIEFQQNNLFLYIFVGLILALCLLLLGSVFYG